jgi:hypothetical protein
VLKISVIETKTQRRLVLEGKLVAPWTAELQFAGPQSANGLGNRELVIDVRNLTVIGHDGEAVLLGLMNRGTRFRSRGMFTKQV